MSRGRLAAAGESFADMPLLLKGITSFFLVFGAGSMLLSLAPGLEHRVGGETLTRAELWESGLGPLALLLGAWLVVSAAGLLRRAAFGRVGACLAWLPFVLLGPAGQAAPAALWAVGTGLYLFRTRGAARFFAGEPASPAP